jgi:hypothetical protein
MYTVYVIAVIVVLFRDERLAKRQKSRLRFHRTTQRNATTARSSVIEWFSKPMREPNTRNHAIHPSDICSLMARRHHRPFTGSTAEPSWLNETRYVLFCYLVFPPSPTPSPHRFVFGQSAKNDLQANRPKPTRCNSASLVIRRHQWYRAAAAAVAAAATAAKAAASSAVGDRPLEVRLHADSR